MLLKKGLFYCVRFQMKFSQGRALRALVILYDKVLLSDFMYHPLIFINKSDDNCRFALLIKWMM